VKRACDQLPGQFFRSPGGRRTMPLSSSVNGEPRRVGGRLFVHCPQKAQGLKAQIFVG
jgi:hypothetical protein